MKKEVIYIAELDQDVDDVVAAEYLNKKGALKMVVCDPLPVTPQGRERKKSLEAEGIRVTNKIPAGAQYIFVGGVLTEVARYIINHKVKYLVMNGGFVGGSLVEKPLDKFKGKEVIRTFNFNSDVIAADRVLKSPNISNIILIGKNVCHHPRNTMNGIWKSEQALLNKYHVRPTKLQHDMLACREGLIYIGFLEEPSYLGYMCVYPYNKGLKGNQTLWGSKREKTNYNKVLAAVDWKADR